MSTKRNYAKTAKIVLQVLAIGGLMTVMGARLDSAKLLKNIYKDITKRRKYYVGEVIDRLIKQGLIGLSDEGLIFLSPEGMQQLEILETNSNPIETPEVWDKKFRVIIFDIPEEKKSIRNAVRGQLAEWGFVRLQNSVWVHPYECQKAVGLLKTKFRVIKDVLFLTVDSIENDGWLKKEFGLP